MDEMELREAILQLVLSHKSWQAQSWIAFDAIEKSVAVLPEDDGRHVRELLEREKERITLTLTETAELLALSLEQALRDDQPFLDLLRTYSQVGR
jgi:uncharacterized protein YhbP (UPF0306 family)